MFSSGNNQLTKKRQAEVEVAPEAPVELPAQDEQPEEIDPVVQEEVAEDEPIVEDAPVELPEQPLPVLPPVDLAPVVPEIPVIPELPALPVVPAVVSAPVVPVAIQPVAVQPVAQPAEDVPVEAPVAPKRKTKKNKKQNGSNLFFKSGDDAQSYNSFFPIVFGGGLGRSSEGGAAGTTAIANSFSTGRRGIASSVAKANGAEGEVSEE